MASNSGHFAFIKSNGWMENEKVIRYHSQRSWNNNFFTFQLENKSIQFCLIKGDILNMDTTCIVNFYEHDRKKTNSIFRIAGSLFENEFNTKLLKCLPNLSRDNHYIFLTLSGEMVNCEYILNFIYKAKNNSAKEIFKTLFESYISIFKLASRSGLKSLAVPLIILENELDVSLKALMEAIIQITEYNDNEPYLKYLYFISENDTVLDKFNYLTTNGFNPEYIILKTTKNIKPIPKNNPIIPVKDQNYQILSKTKNFENLFNVCDICSKKSLLISNFLDENFLKNCPKHNCKICSIATKISILFQNINAFEKFCIFCVGNLIDKLKYSTCSSCLRNIGQTKCKKNKYCNKDLICSRCDNSPVNTSKNCYICEFFVFFQKLEEKKLILDHDIMTCCYDYCDLSTFEFENIKKLSCGHTSCSKMIFNSKLCSICSIQRLLEQLSKNYQLI